MTPTKTSGLEAWLDVVRDQKMPIFEQTVHHILSISEDDLSPWRASSCMHRPPAEAGQLDPFPKTIWHRPRPWRASSCRMPP
jgi:hypothetical protein